MKLPTNIQVYFCKCGHCIIISMLRATKTHLNYVKLNRLTFDDSDLSELFP